MIADFPNVDQCGEHSLITTTNLSDNVRAQVPLVQRSLSVSEPAEEDLFGLGGQIERQFDVLFRSAQQVRLYDRPQLDRALVGDLDLQVSGADVAAAANRLRYVGGEVAQSAQL